jgi:predicted nicotinamide N-methyase
MSSLASALSAGDTDAVRMMLQRLATPSETCGPHATSGEAEVEEAEGREGEESEVEEEEEEELAAPDRLIEQVHTVADTILKAGLPHLEREAAAAEASSAAAAAPATPLLGLPELGLKLRAQAVMGQAVWPAALALCHWLQDEGRPGACAGARCIELGAGGGAPGLVALSKGASFLLATDVDTEVLSLLRANCEANARDDTAWDVASLDWRDAVAIATHAADGFDLVLAADVLYSVGDVVPLLRAARALLRPGARARFALARSAWFEDLQPTLVASAEELGMLLVEDEGVRTGDGAEARVLVFANGTA